MKFLIVYKNLMNIFLDSELFSTVCMLRKKKLLYIKGTVARDFRPSVFFVNQSPLGP
jgi:hypothetical protein